MTFQIKAIFIVVKVSKMLLKICHYDGSFLKLKCDRNHCQPVLSPDPAGGAYDTPPHFLVGSP